MPPLSSLLAAFRLPARSVRISCTPLNSRLLSTSILRQNPLIPYAARLPTSPILISCHQQRYLSLGSIFTRPTPSPLTVAHITRLEAEANGNPHDVAKQLALLQALAGTNLKPGYDLVITRWERMCELDPSSPLLASDAAFQLYLTSLVKTGQESSVNPAVRRRESLLAASATVVADASVPAADISSSAPSSQTESLLASSAATAQPSDPQSTLDPELVSQSTAAPASPSQQIAQSVLAGHAAGSVIPPVPAGASPTPDLASLTAALGSGAGTGANPVQVAIVERRGSWIPRLARFVILTLLGGFFVLVLLAVMLENSGLMKAGPRQTQYEATDGKRVKFSDVHGVDEVKDELQDVVSFLKDPTAFGTLGGKLPKGVLLTGSPGTGKTMLARAVAGEAGVPFFFASGSDFEEMFVGVGAKRVRDLFAAARKKAPAIIFIDELDAVGGKRSGRDAQYMKQTLNQLLVEMDGFMQNEGVIVIAATNFPESLDQALVRPGRFDRIIAVPLPDVRGRVQILMHHMRGVTTSKDVDPKILARGTPGFSGADLQNMVNQAAVQAAKEQAKEVNLKHFEWAKDRIVMGAERKSHYVDAKSKLLTAYHEGGHALTALYTDGAMPLHKVTCVTRGHALGLTAQLPKDDRTSVSYKEFLAEIDVCMGGRVAEELIYGPENVTSGASSDIRHATQTAQRMVKYWGYSEKLGPVYYSERDSGNISPRRQEEIEDEVRRLIQSGQARVTALLKEKEEELHRLARALVEHETLDSDEVRKVIKGEAIRSGKTISEILEEDLAKVAA